nr:fenitrothion hydrolase [Actinomycetota bacterium]
MRRAAKAVAVGAVLAATAPAPAYAHGVAARSDIPIPDWLFFWAASLVLIVSFVVLAALWPKPKLHREHWRPLPGGIGRALASRPVEVACGGIGVFLLIFTVASGLVGEQIPSSNFATTFVYVVFWVGLVPVSVIFGDVFRAFNPWRAIGRTVDWAAGSLAGEP